MLVAASMAQSSSVAVLGCSVALARPPWLWVRRLRHSSYTMQAVHSTARRGTARPFPVCFGLLSIRLALSSETVPTRYSAAMTRRALGSLLLSVTVAPLPASVPGSRQTLPPSPPQPHRCPRRA
eukprot:4374400-Prymnesium_polylepis.1